MTSVAIPQTLPQLDQDDLDSSNQDGTPSDSLNLGDQKKRGRNDPPHVDVPGLDDEIILTPKNDD